MKKFILIMIVVLLFTITFTTQAGNEIQFNCTDEEKEIILETLQKNNIYYIEQLTKDNCKIYVLYEVVADDGDKCLGYIQYQDGNTNIYIKKGYIEQTLNHEIGHYVDFQSYSYDLNATDEFWDIYVEEKDYFDNDYMSGSSNEYFAESYNQYVSGNLEFKAQCPKTWAYIDKMIKGNA